MNQRVVLAWDLGTSGAKVGLVTDQGEILAHEFEPTPLELLPGGGAEQSPESWWAALSLATERLLAREVVPRDAIAALGVTAQWSGTVALDREGKPLMNAIIWMDARGARHVRAVTGGAVRVAGYSPMKLARWVRLTGGAPARSGKDSLSHILFIQRERPDVYERAHRFLEPKDYLGFRLTGRAAASFDSIALHWVTDNRDPNRVAYDAGLVELAGIDRDKLPELLRATDVLGPLAPEHRERFGLSKNVVVAVGAADVHSAAVGAGTTRHFATHLYVGTSSWISCHVPAKKTDIQHNMAALPGALPGTYLLLNEQECAGACLTHLRDKLFFARDELGGAPPKDVFKLFDAAAAKSPPGSRGLLFLPWLYGERTPVENHALRGGFLNYSLVHERSDVIRSVLEGVALNSRWLFGYVERFVGTTIGELRFIGGGAESALWTQIFADVLGRAVLRVDRPLLSNLRGAGMIALLALRAFTPDEVERRVPVIARVEPRPDRVTLYDRLFSEFMQIHECTRPIFERLNGKPEAK